MLKDSLSGAKRLRAKGLTHLIQVLNEPSKMLPGDKRSLGKRFQCACRRALSCVPFSRLKTAFLLNQIAGNHKIGQPSVKACRQGV